MITIYHNPRCSKSRETLVLIKDRDIEPEVILYLNTPPNASTINELLEKLNMKARDIIRTSEVAYKEKNLKDCSLSEQALIEAIVEHPKLLQRPIVVKGSKAVIGRPPENVLALLSDDD